MKFVLEITCDNAAFCDDDGDPDPGFEVATILRSAAKAVENGAESVRLYDTNGNRVGVAKFAEE